LAGLESRYGARAGLERDIAGYVLTGQPRTVPAELKTAVRALGQQLRLCGLPPPLDEEALRGFYAGFSSLPPAVALRWTQVLDAGWNDGAARHHGLAMPDGSHWAEHLLVHAATEAKGQAGQRDRAVGPSASCMEALLSETGLPPQALLLAAFTVPAEVYSWVRRAALLVTDLPGFPQQLQRNLALVRPLLSAPSAEQRALLAELLAQADPATLAELAPEVTEFATCGSKQVRGAAEALLFKGGMLLVPALHKLAVKGKTEQRLHALRGLWLIAGQQGDAGLRAAALALAQADKAGAVQALAAEWSSSAAAAAAPPAAPPAMQWSLPLTAELDAALADLADAIYIAVRERNDEAIQESGKKGAPPLELWDYLTDADAATLRGFLGEHALAAPPLEGRYGWSPFGEPLQAFAARPGVTPAAVVKLLLAFAPAKAAAGKILVKLLETAHRANGRPSLLELQQLLEPAGVTAEQVFDDYFHTWSGLQFDWLPHEIWPFLEQHQDLVRRKLAAPAEDRYGFDRMKLYRALAMLPRMGAAYADVLFEQALGAQKSWRLPAQDALAAFEGKVERILAALASSKADARTAAANWLMRLNHAPAVAALEAAVAREKHDVAKGAMLDALQRFGQPVEKYLDPDALLKEARKTQKDIHQDLAWFPWGAMPQVAWAGSAAPVAPDILKFLLVQAFKQKNPEPNAVLRKFCGMFEPAGRDCFGQFVLECWLAQDVSTVSQADAAAMAIHDGRALHADMQQIPGLYQGHPMEGRSEPELIAWCLKQRLSQPAGNAVASKGVLAVAAACAGARAAAPVERYLKAWYGTRPSQGKSLIAMLAWIDQPSAIQLVLAVGSRFRTRSFQEEASRQIEALAERKGWSVAELADRTVPGAGFDEAGVLELPFGAGEGSRVFTARLGPDFKVALFNEEGKAIAALPEPRAGEDAALAKDARSALAAAKKELKTVVSQQADRLYEALCVEREWQFEDWQLYLNRHPIVRRLAQQLVWAEVEGAEGGARVVRTFRPLDDGTLTSRHEEAVRPAPAARIRLAHDTILAQEEVAGWLAHLADYEVAALFPQLGKGVYALPEALRHAAGIDDFKGHAIKAFALRTRAQKLGYARGATQDGGWFYSYDRRFAALGLTAHVEFTGNSLPEADRETVLTRLSFTDNRSGSAAPLGKIPAVLLSECYHDMRLLAAAGSGHTEKREANVE
jgi:hypothetical protein